MSDKSDLINLEDLTPRTSPDDCQTMCEVRDGVDRLDRALVALIAERASYMRAAAKIKPERNIVRDPARIDDVVNKVLYEAQRQGLPNDIAEAVWRELIERSIQYEFLIWDELRNIDAVQQA